VRMAPVRVMVADRRVSPWVWEGGEMVTTAVGNAMRIAVARSPACTRGGRKRGACIARVAMGGGERGGREESVGALAGDF
jgi:hypothetical protein